MTRPFLTIVTRCSQRPRSLMRMVRSVLRQTDLDAEHLFLVDKRHRGLKFANQQFYRYRYLPEGEYVWALDDDDMMNEPFFIARVKATARETDADVILVKTIHEHSGNYYPQPEIWNLDWRGGERPEFWVGGGYCVVVRREVWQRHLEDYFDGQDVDWTTGGDWHFITSLIEDKSLHFEKCDVVAGRQPERGYGNQVEPCTDDWFDAIENQLDLEHIKREAYRLDYRENSPDLQRNAYLGIDKPMNVLQLAQWDWAGCAYMLAQALNEHTIHSARAVRWRQDGSFDFPTDVVSPTDDEFAKLWRWADIIHIHDSAPIPRRFPKKPTVITMHGSKYRTSPDKYAGIARRRGWLLTVATPDLTAIHDAPWMPDTRVGLPDPEPTSEHFTVLHCPSIRANKGTKHVLDAMRHFHHVRFKLIEDVSWRECLRIKASVERGCLIDQFEWGYGCNAIEAWHYGLPVISNAIGPARDAFDTLFDDDPFLTTSPDEIADAVACLLDPDVYERVKQAGVEHYKRYHEPSAAADIALSFYERVIQKHKSEEPEGTNHAAPIGAGGMTLLHYLGHNYGLTTWYGPETGQEYRFSAAEPYKYVDNRDVKAMLSITRHTNQIFEIAEG